MTIKTIYIEWDGPYTFDELVELNDPSADYGLYQVYGAHPLYGEEVLLYLGRTETGTLGQKLEEERAYWEAESDFEPYSIYVGRLAGTATPAGGVWAREMDQAARLLVYAHCPVFTGRELGAAPDEDLKDVHVVNWGNFLDLAPEVSGARWIFRFQELPNYNYYGRHGELAD